MKKVLALALALVVALCALSVAVFADEKVVYDNPEGAQPPECANPWDFFGICGATWGRADSCDISVPDFVDLCQEGGWTLDIVYSGTPNNIGDANDPNADPKIVFNADFDNGILIPHVDIGDGKLEASVALDDVMAAYGTDPVTISSACVQVFTGDFKLYSVKFTNGTDTVAPVAVEEPAAEEPAAEETPAGTAEAPETGITLAVIPAVMALAAVAASKKH